MSACRSIVFHVRSNNHTWRLPTTTNRKLNPKYDQSAQSRLAGKTDTGGTSLIFTELGEPS